MSNNTDHHRGDNGTDIGRIRCLVCDQVVKQSTEQDIVFGGPGMTHTIKSRKGSPPRGKDRGRSPPPTHQRPNSAGNDHGNSKYRAAAIPPSDSKSKLTKLVAAAATTDTIHEDHEGELPIIAQPTKIVLVDRHSSTTTTNNNNNHESSNALLTMTDDALDSPPKPSHHPISAISAPRVVATKQPTIVTSLSNPALHDNVDSREYVTDYMPMKDLTVTGADNVMYFRELEGYVSPLRGHDQCFLNCLISIFDCY